MSYQIIKIPQEVPVSKFTVSYSSYSDWYCYETDSIRIFFTTDILNPNYIKDTVIIHDISVKINDEVCLIFSENSYINDIQNKIKYNVNLKDNFYDYIHYTMNYYSIKYLYINNKLYKFNGNKCNIIL